MVIDYQPQGVCSKRMEIEVEEGMVRSLRVSGGCSGNLQGICSLVQGLPVEQVIARLEGISCGFKKTSCPDQLARALRSCQSEG